MSRATGLVITFLPPDLSKSLFLYECLPDHTSTEFPVSQLHKHSLIVYEQRVSPSKPSEKYITFKGRFFGLTSLFRIRT